MTSKALNDILRYGYVLTAIVILITVFSAVLGYRSIRSNEEKELQRVFDVVTKNQFDAVERRINNVLHSLESLKVFFSASDYVSRDEFAVMAHNFIDPAKEIKNLYWIPLVKYKARKAFEQSARHTGVESFQFHEGRDANKIYTKAPLKPFYYPVYYMEPYYVDNALGLGFDMGSKDLFLDTIKQAQVTGIPGGTRAFHMLMGNQWKLVFFVCVPVYQKDAVVFLPQGRLDGFLGVVGGVFGYDKLVTDVFENIWEKRTTFFLFDNCNMDDELQLVYLNKLSNKIMWSNLSDFNNVKALNLRHLFAEYKYVNTREFYFLGRKWTMVSVADPELIDHYLTSRPLFVFWTIMVVGTLLVFILWSLLRRNLSIHNTVEQRTKALNDIRKKLEESRQQYMLAVAGSQDGIWDWDLKTNDLFLSPKWKEMLGYKDHELKNEYMTFYNLLHPEDKPRVEVYTDKYLKGATEHFRLEFRLRHKLGHYVNIVSRGEAVRDNNGIPYRMAGSHTDITEQKQREKKLTRSETKFRTLYNSSSEAIMVLDTEKFLDCNEETIKLFRFNTKSDFLMKHPADVSPPVQPDGTPSMEKAMHYINKAIQEENVRFEWVHRKANGIDFLAEVSLASMEIDGKTVLQAIVRDIGQAKKAEEDIQSTVEELERFNCIMIERESRIIEMKKEVNNLLIEQGKNKKYSALDDEQTDPEDESKGQAEV